MTISITIDWLSFTTKGTVTNETLLRLFDGSSAIPETARFGYTTALRSTSGLVVMSNPGREEMGRHWVLSGSCLRTLAEEKSISSFDVLRGAVSGNAKFTRLDLAKDAINEKIDTHHIWTTIQNGKTVGTSKSFSQIENLDGGHTIYIGSRVSDKFARLYDKGREQGTQDDWKRFEVECKGDVAKQLARVLADPRNDPSAVFDGIIKGMVQMKDENYIRFFGVDLPIGLPKIEKITDRETWIRTQVLPAVVEHYRQYPESSAVKDLISVLIAIAGEQEGAM